MVAQCTDAPRMNCKLVVVPQVVGFEWSESRNRVYELATDEEYEESIWPREGFSKAAES